jgi:type II secretory pathway pseudopilin PulG
MRKNNGHTLLELILGIAIAGMVLLAIYSNFLMGIRVYDRVRNDLVVEAQMILRQISSELRSAVLSPGTDSPFLLTGQPDSVKFVIASFEKDCLQPSCRAGLWEVNYYLSPLQDTGSASLIREVVKIHDDKRSRESTKEQLSKNIRMLRFTYFDGATWIDAWGDTAKLPRAVRLELSLSSQDKAKSQEVVSLIIGMP